MIRVVFVGGTRKSFESPSVDIDRKSIAIRDLLDMIQRMRISGSPEIDPKSTLVAINGADISATGGMSSVARDGDTVSIIPIVHGGGGEKEEEEDAAAAGVTRHAVRASIRIRKRRFDILRVRPKRPADASFLDDLRDRHPSLRIQAISARFVLDRSHAEKILALSSESERRKILLANRIETDILMRFALTTQISDAIKRAGIGKPAPRSAFMLVSTGPSRALDSMYRHLLPLLEAPFASDNSSFLRKHFGITKRALAAAISDDPLADILAERAAVLGADAA